MGLTTNHQTFTKMAAVIQSTEGTKAAAHATSKRLPALAGVDPLLQAELGVDYTRDNQVTMNTAWLVAQEIHAMGFVDAGSARQPEDCVAATALVFRLPQ